MKNNWEIEVIFVGDYASDFRDSSEEEIKDSKYRFQISIMKVMEDVGVVPMIGDWIYPISKSDYPLDIGKISARDFDPANNKILFEIE